MGREAKKSRKKSKESPDFRFPEVGISAKTFCGVYYVLVPTMISHI